MSKSTRGIRAAGIASLAVTLSLGVAAPAFAVEGFTLERIGGEDRYETAALVADEYSATNDNVILANGQPGFYADALAANYLAGVLDAPILLTNMKQIPEYTLDQLDEMNAQTVTVVGGEGVVPPAQVEQLEDEGYTVERVAGDDRFETNADVINEGGQATDGIGLIATGFDFPDALAAGPFAYQGHPLGLSTEDEVKDVVLDALEADGVDQVLIFGGESVVGQGVEDDLASRGITVLERFDGDDRSETSELAAEWALENLDFTDEHVGVASGYTEGYGADALAGGPLEGKEMSPMLITRNVDNADDALSFIEAHSDTLVDGHLFGGPGAVSVAAEAAMEEAGQGDAPASNQDYTASPAGNQVVEAGTVQQFSFSGITQSSVDIELFDCSNVATDENGVTTFSGTNPGGSGNVAQEDSAPTAEITVVNGVSGATTNNVSPNNGTVTFSVTTDAADAGTCYVAVVYNDADDDNRLDLNADGTPSEAFGNSGDVTVVKQEAQDNDNSIGTVQYVNKAANLFEDETNTFYYDSNDEFILAGATAAQNRSITMDEFEARISKGDNVDGNYRSNPANQSSFTLTDSAPLAPSPVTAQEPQTGTNDGKQGVEIAFDDSDTDTVASYNVYRATATQPTITGAPITCPTDLAGYTKVGSVEDKATATADNTADYFFLDSTATPGADATPNNPSYCYYVTAVDSTGDEGPASDVTDPSRAYKADAPSSAPTFTDASAGSYDNATGNFTLVLDYTEAVADGTTVPSDFHVVYSVGGASYTLTVASESTSGDKVTLVANRGDAPAPGTLTTESITVSAKTGTDGNTVGDLDTPQQFQPVGDAVFLDDADVTGDVAPAP